jgi:hypothetical protein
MRKRMCSWGKAGTVGDVLGGHDRMNVLLGSERNKHCISRQVGANIGSARPGVKHILRPEPLMWSGPYRWKKRRLVNSPPVSVLTRAAWCPPH